MLPTKRSRFGFACTSLGVLLSSLLYTTGTHAQSFKDVPSSDPLYEAIDYLRSKNILQGYEDGSFRPKQKVTRAEAVKIIVASKNVTAAQLAPVRESSFDDVQKGIWYLSYVEWARQQLGIIDGPPKTKTFNGGRNVKKVEFLKMVLEAKGLDENAFGEIKITLSRDAAGPDAWYYPYLRLALATSMVAADSNNLLYPDSDLTRGDVATLLFRLAMYQEGKRTQTLLTITESEIMTVLDSLQLKKTGEAEFASARALIAARGAHSAKPDSPIVKGALKITEGFRAVVRGYKAGLEKKYDESVQLSKDAWFLADIAAQTSPDLLSVSGQLKTIATSLAAEARLAKN